MQVSREAEGRSKCVPRLHGPCRAPASGLAGQDSGGLRAGHVSCEVERDSPGYQHHRDRKSTRLNSSHSQISYAVFCLKKKKTQRQTRSDYPSLLSNMLLRPLVNCTISVIVLYAFPNQLMGSAVHYVVSVTSLSL